MLGLSEQVIGSIELMFSFILDLNLDLNENKSFYYMVLQNLYSWELVIILDIFSKGLKIYLKSNNFVKATTQLKNAHSLFIGLLNAKLALY